MLTRKQILSFFALLLIGAFTASELNFWVDDIEERFEKSDIEFEESLKEANGGNKHWFKHFGPDSKLHHGGYAIQAISLQEPKEISYKVHALHCLEIAHHPPLFILYHHLKIACS